MNRDSIIDYRTVLSETFTIFVLLREWVYVVSVSHCRHHHVKNIKALPVPLSIQNLHLDTTTQRTLTTMEQTSQDITPAPSVIIPSTQVLSASLLGLPGELRERILVEVVRRHDTINLSSLRPPPIALVNRQLFRETAAALCEANTFAVDVDLAYRILVTRPQDAVGDSPRPRLRVFSAVSVHSP